MTRSRGNNGSRLRDDDVEADGESDPEGSYVWKDRKFQILLELIIGELKANGYSSRMPNVAGKKRVENKLLELTGDKNVFWDIEIKNKMAYLRKLWQTNNQLMNCTGVVVDPSSGQIVMPSSWWTDRIVKPLPFKDLLDQIYGEHDVEQDEPHLKETHSQTQEGNREGTQQVLDVRNLSASNDEVPKQAKRRTSSSCPPRRKANFEAQIENSRKDLLEELRSRKIQKLSYGDATAILEKLQIEQLGTFWWAANKLLKNDGDIREDFIKFESEEIKIKYLEALTGVDRFGNQCNNVDLALTSNTMENSQQIGFGYSQNFDDSPTRFTARGKNFTTLLGMDPSKLREP
ncbi:unnamed protein product [Eruca vesicaria subsp. sativa]|uniref:Myb/SANT-like domain-containing protein n=1 Tax=Eruca vesicaria subsp. sativa TaxID=29727 RepID=A0ABC8J1Y7_ERUVS|nr:unnamed protein product [Eruca vesicaria subsp. sativa]